MSVLRRLRLGFALAAVLACLSVPMSGSAFHGNTGALAECSSVTDAAGVGSCAVTFVLKVPGFASVWETHAHFHAPLPEVGTTKYVRMEWRDRLNRLVWSSSCQDIGLSTDWSPLFANLGPTDAIQVHCTTKYHRTSYARGTQTLIVSATSEGDATPGDVFHGRLIVSANDQPF